MNITGNQRFLPFFVLSENRAEPFTSDLEAAAVFSMAELDRARGGGLILKQPEETVAFIAKMGYPLWVCSWREIALVFDGLNQNSYTMPYAGIPDVNSFADNLKRGGRMLETYVAFVGDCVSYFQAPAAEKSLLVNGLMRDPQFLSEFDTHRREAVKTLEEDVRVDLLPPIFDESAVAPGIRDLENLHKTFESNVETLYVCMKFLTKTTQQYVKQLREKASIIKEEFAVKIREEEQEMAPRISQLKDDYDFRINVMAKSFEKRRLPVQQEKARLEKSREHANARLERYKLEAKASGDKGHAAAEQKWKDKAGEMRKELSEIEKQLKQTEKSLHELEEQRSVETFGLKEDSETKIREARKNLLDLEAARDARIIAHQQETEKLETQTKLINDEISKVAKLLEAEIAQFKTLGFEKPGMDGSLLFYVPFYVIGYQAEQKKRFTIIPPSVVNAVGVFTKLKGALGMAKIWNLLVPRFKTVSSLVDGVRVLAEKNVAFEAEITDYGAKNNILARMEVREGVKKGLAVLKDEGWLSDKEFSEIASRTG